MSTDPQQTPTCTMANTAVVPLYAASCVRYALTSCASMQAEVLVVERVQACRKKGVHAGGQQKIVVVGCMDANIAD